MKIYKNQNVYDAALGRIRRLFDEFDRVVVSVSGGKDSTVVFHLALQIAREKNKLPLTVFFVDQEAEWEATIEQIRYSMYHEDVDPLWLQVPFKLFNATSAQEHWLQCWDPNEEENWVHPKDPLSFKENVYKAERFKPLYTKAIDYHYPDETVAQILGMRAEESPARYQSMTSVITYKDITWGARRNPRLGHYNFYPIYDWSYTDVWKAIHDHDWPYNRIYDVQYEAGYPVKDMRVSNVHHETAVTHLFYMQEMEPETYERLTQRISGIDMAGKLGRDDYFVKDLPFMFASWKEYRDYLLEHLVDNPKWKANFRKEFDRQEEAYYRYQGDRVFKTHINSILTNDWEGIKLTNFDNQPESIRNRMANKGEKFFV